MDARDIYRNPNDVNRFSHNITLREDKSYRRNNRKKSQTRKEKSMLRSHERIKSDQSRIEPSIENKGATKLVNKDLKCNPWQTLTEPINRILQEFLVRLSKR